MFVFTEESDTADLLSQGFTELTLFRDLSYTSLETIESITSVERAPCSAY